MPIDERRYSKPNPPTQFDVESIFRDSSRLVIPAWQREYAWTGENEVEDLLSDLTKFIGNPHRENYLLGSIITFPKNRDRVVAPEENRDEGSDGAVSGCVSHTDQEHAENLSA